MDAAELVTFRTSKGTTFTKKRDDPLVATLVSMYDECGLPSVIELFNSVGEIVDEEYPLLARVLALNDDNEEYVMAMIDVMTGFAHNYARDPPTMNQLNRIRRARKAMVEVTYDPTAEPLNTDVTYLHQLNKIRRVLDVESEALAWALVDERIAHNDRMAHYKVIGEVMVESELLRENLYIVNDYSLRQLVDVLMATMDDEALKGVGTVLLGILVNGLGIALSKKSVAAEEIIWSDVVKVLEDVKMTNRGLLFCIETIKMFAAPIPVMTTISLLHIPFDESRHLLGFQMRDATFILSKTLASLPETIKPRDLGLASLTEGTMHPYAESACGPMYVTQLIIHSAIASKSNYHQIQVTRRVKNIKMLDSILGRHTIVRILLSLLHAIERGEGNERVEGLASTVERYLEDK